MATRPGLLLVGGGGGFVGRHLVEELGQAHRIRSLHRRPVDRERELGIEWVPGDVSEVRDWAPLLAGCESVVNLAWYRAGPARRFRALRLGLERLIASAGPAGVRCFVQLSVPAAPTRLEDGLPYLVEKRRVDRALATSGVPYRILRPTMLYGQGDVLLGVMLGLMRRYRRFPMFGDGSFRVSPVWAGDLARIVGETLVRGPSGTIDVGGPRAIPYRELTDLLFQRAGLPPRYWHLSEAGGARLAGLLEALGSHLIYRYEVEWLVSGRLGLPPYRGLGRPMRTVEEYLGLPRNARTEGNVPPSAPPPGAADEQV